VRIKSDVQSPEITVRLDKLFVSGWLSPTESQERTRNLGNLH